MTVVYESSSSQAGCGEVDKTSFQIKMCVDSNCEVDDFSELKADGGLQVKEGQYQSANYTLKTYLIDGLTEKFTSEQQVKVIHSNEDQVLPAFRKSLTWVRAKYPGVYLQTVSKQTL